MIQALPKRILDDLAEIVAKTTVSPYFLGVQLIGEETNQTQVCWDTSQTNTICVYPHKDSNKKLWVDWRGVAKWLDNSTVVFHSRSKDFSFPFIQAKGNYDNFSLTINILSQPKQP